MKKKPKITVPSSHTISLIVLNSLCKEYCEQLPIINTHQWGEWQAVVDNYTYKKNCVRCGLSLSLSEQTLEVQKTLIVNVLDDMYQQVTACVMNPSVIEAAVTAMTNPKAAVYVQEGDLVYDKEKNKIWIILSNHRQLYLDVEEMSKLPVPNAMLQSGIKHMQNMNHHAHVQAYVGYLHMYGSDMLDMQPDSAFHSDSWQTQSVHISSAIATEMLAEAGLLPEQSAAHAANPDLPVGDATDDLTPDQLEAVYKWLDDPKDRTFELNLAVLHSIRKIAPDAWDTETSATPGYTQLTFRRRQVDFGNEWWMDIAIRVSTNEPVATVSHKGSLEEWRNDGAGS